MRPAVQDFLNHVQKDCEKNGVLLQLTEGTHVQEVGSMELSNGFFSPLPTPTLAVAMGKPEEQWLPVLVHEYCHFDQWRECDPIWVSGASALNDLFAVLDATNTISRSYIPIFTKLIRALELDCEERAARKIQEWDLPIDVKRYIRTANAYVWFYTMIPELGSWYIPGKEPYRDEKILALCTDYFLDDYTCMPEYLRQEYLRLMQK